MMMSTASPPADMDSIESALHSGLMSSDAIAETVTPILRHLLTSQDRSLFGDEIVARVKGMLNHISTQLLNPGNDTDEAGAGDAVLLGETLLKNTDLLTHLHALALEWQLAQRIEARFGIDPVLTPLLQSLLASDDADTARLAKLFLASQARHIQAQRRMSLPLLELPAELLNAALTAFRSVSHQLGNVADDIEAVRTQLQCEYDQMSTRHGLATQLISTSGMGANDLLSIRNAGATLFISALSAGARIGRDLAALSTHESQAARLVLSLRASGLTGEAALDQCHIIHPDVPLQADLGRLSRDRAADLLAAHGAHFGS